MTADEVAERIQEHIETLFPRRCSCGIELSCHGEYIENTVPLGMPVAFDEWPPSVERAPVGILAFSNCLDCGSSMAVSTQGIPEGLHRTFLAWVMDEARARDSSVEAVMQDVRERIRAISLRRWEASKQDR